MTLFSVPDMSCGHCKASVEAALAPIAKTVVVDLTARQVQVEGAPDEAVIGLLESVGFPATVVT